MPDARLARTRRAYPDLNVSAAGLALVIRTWIETERDLQEWLRDRENRENEFEALYAALGRDRRKGRL